MLVDLQKKYGDRGLQIIGIALDNLEAVKTFAVSCRLTTRCLVPQPAWGCTWQQDRRNSLRRVDRDGKVVQQIRVGP